MLNLLIILACLAGGYWLVSSIMSPGVDLTRTKKPEEKPAGKLETKPAEIAADRQSSGRLHDWHLILDIPPDANRREIEHAYKRCLAKAQSTGDSDASQRIRDAYATGMSRAGR